MKLRHGLAAFAAAALATPAGAVTVVATYEGTIFNSQLLGDLFGGGGFLALEGKAFVASFTFDSTKGSDSTSIDGSTRFLQGFGAGNPIIAASIRIDGHTEDMGSQTTTLDDEGFISQTDESLVPNGTVDGVGHEMQNLDANTFSEMSAGIFSVSRNIVDTNDYTAPLVYILTPGPFGPDFYSGSFRKANFQNTSLLASAQGSFIITKVTIAPLQVVPEPATWAMLILGFAAIGCSLRCSGVPRPA